MRMFVKDMPAHTLSHREIHAADWALMLIMRQLLLSVGVHHNGSFIAAHSGGIVWNDDASRTANTARCYNKQRQR